MGVGESERYLYFSVVTGTRYGTKTPPGQQPTNPCAGDMTSGDLFTWGFRYGRGGKTNQYSEKKIFKKYSKKAGC